MREPTQNPVVCDEGLRTQQDRLRQAEQEIAAIGQWVQETILAALRRRTEEKRPGDWPPSRPSVVDGEVLHVEDEPGGSRW